MKKTAYILLFAILIYFLSSFSIKYIKKVNLQNAIKDIQNSEDFKNATIAIAAKYEGEDEFLFEKNSHDLIHPCSNFKLFTASATLKYLGPEFTYSTKIYEFTDRHQRSNLVLVGSGDPSLSSERFNDFIEAIKNFTSKNGSITGDLYFDESIFTGEKYGPGWLSEWQNEYFAVPISGLQIDDNLLTIIGGNNEKGVFEIHTFPFDDYSPLINDLHFVEDLENVKNNVKAHFNEDGTLYIPEFRKIL